MVIERKIVAAAVKKYGVVFTGVRHGHVIKSMVDVGFLSDMKNDYVLGKEQGFVDSHNNYLSRAQAWHVAVEAGQIDEGHGVLYSEDLW